MAHTSEATIGKTQGVMASPKLFNVAGNILFNNFSHLQCRLKTPFMTGLEWCWEGLWACLCRWRYHWIVGPRVDPSALNVLIGLFCMVSLMSNISKFNTMTFQPGAICTGMSEEDFSWWVIVYGAIYQEHLQRHIPCPEFRVELVSISVTAHCRWFHGTYPAIECYRLTFIQTEYLLLVYEVIFPTTMKSC